MRDLSSIARVKGPNLTLRLIEPDDATYIHSLRNNPTYNTHLSKVTGTIDDQRTWIEEYKSRETHGQEFYYVIEWKDGTRCGLVRLYNIEAASFIWGSWILDENRTRKAALESAILSFGIGYEALGMQLANVDLRVANEHMAAFYRRLGMVETHRTDQDIFFNYSRDQFYSSRTHYLKQLSEN
ncbi:GNAT family N-acetyltransferase [Amylibacter sp.]|nr:GNAT family N-acetyltransferase [Amylibacter sp.]